MQVQKLERISRFDRANTAGYAMSLVYPRMYGMKYQPPTLFMQPTFAKKIDASVNITTVTDQALREQLNALTDPPNQWNGSDGVQNQIVSLQNGLLLWLPQRGIDSCWRMGFVLKGTQCLNHNDNLWDPSIFNNGLSEIAGIDGVVKSVTFTESVAMPYINSAQVNFSPAIEETFSKARLYTGDFRVVSKTTSIGNTALAGRLSCGAVTDTRDISQSSGQAYAINDLVQTSMTAKDGEKEVSVQDGIITLLGPDARGDLSPPKSALRTILNGSTTFVSQPTLEFLLPESEKRNGNELEDYPVCTYFVSPIGATVQATTDFGLDTRTNNIQVPPIDEGGVLQVSGNFRIDTFATLPVATDITLSVRYSVTIVNYYARVMPNGLIQFETASNSVDASFILGLNNNKKNYQFDTNDLTKSTGMASQGKYVGTSVTVSIQRNYTPSAQAFPDLRIVVQPGTFQITATTVEEPGRTGPAHLIRWDNVTGGQNLNIDGELYAQVVPQGNIAPFTQNDAQLSRHASNVSALSYVADLFNASTFIKRNWRLNMYEEYMKEIQGATIKEQLIAWSRSNITLMGGMEASGFAPTMADDDGDDAAELAASGNFRDMIGRGARTVSNISNAVGSISNRVAGALGASSCFDPHAAERRARAMSSQQAAGQWGTMQSAGQFGAY